jgi:hypothetical protein
MSRANLKQSLFGLSKWVAFILGCGALFAGEAQANKAQNQSLGTMGPSNSLGRNSDQALVRLEGEKIYISHDGSTFRELSLADAPEANYFKQLLRDATSGDREIAVPLGHIIVANGGGGANGAKAKEAKKKKMEQKDTPKKDAPPAGK